MVPDHGWTYENFETESQVRGMDLGTFLRATQRQNTEGLPVKLEVPVVTWRTHRRWDLLMIYTKPWRILHIGQVGQKRSNSITKEIAFTYLSVSSTSYLTEVGRHTREYDRDTTAGAGS